MPLLLEELDEALADRLAVQLRRSFQITKNAGQAVSDRLPAFPVSRIKPKLAWAGP
jgi:hypothetical protein